MYEKGCRYLSEKIIFEQRNAYKQWTPDQINKPGSIIA